MNIANEWKDYEILDMANGEKLERWGNIYLIRPDPQIIWKDKSYPNKWNMANARYNRSNTGGGAWEYKKRLPESWQIKYKNLTFNIINPLYNNRSNTLDTILPKNFYEYVNNNNNLSPEIKTIPISLSNTTSSWSDEIFVRKGQILRFDESNWYDINKNLGTITNKTINLGNGIFKNFSHGLVLKIEPRLALFCSYGAEEETSIYYDDEGSEQQMSISAPQCYDLEEYQGAFRSLFSGETKGDMATYGKLTIDSYDLGARKIASISQNQTYGNFSTFSYDFNESSSDFVYITDYVLPANKYLRFLVLDNTNFNFTSNTSNNNGSYQIVFQPIEYLTNGQQLAVVLADKTWNGKDSSGSWSKTTNPVAWLTKYNMDDSSENYGMLEETGSNYEFNNLGWLVKKGTSNYVIDVSSENFPNLSNIKSDEYSDLRLFFKIIDKYETCGNKKGANITSTLCKCSGESDTFYRSCYNISCNGENIIQKEVSSCNNDIYANNSGLYKVQIESSNNGNSAVNAVEKFLSSVLMEKLFNIFDGTNVRLKVDSQGNKEYCTYETSTNNYCSIFYEDNQTFRLNPGDSCVAADNEGQVDGAKYCYNNCNSLTTNEQQRTLCKTFNDGKGFVKKFYQSIISDNTYQRIVTTSFALMFSFYGLYFLLGLADFNQEELIKRLIKISFIYLMISPTGWNYYNEFFVKFFKDGIDYLSFAIVSSFADDISISNAMATANYSDKSVIFSSIDSSLQLIFSDRTASRIWGLLFSTLPGFVYIILIYWAVGLFLFSVITAMVIYSMSQVLISFFLAFGPIFFVCLIFDKTKGMFDKWLSNLIGLSFEQIFVLTCASFFNVILYNILKAIFSYKVCYESIFSIGRLEIIKFWRASDSDIPGLFQILLIFLIAHLSKNFVKLMANLGAGIGGADITSTDLSGGIVDTATGFVKPAVKMAQSVVKKGAVGMAKKMGYQSKDELDEENDRNERIRKEKQKALKKASNKASLAMAERYGENWRNDEEHKEEITKAFNEELESNFIDTVSSNGALIGDLAKHGKNGMTAKELFESDSSSLYSSSSMLGLIGNQIRSGISSSKLQKDKVAQKSWKGQTKEEKKLVKENAKNLEERSSKDIQAEAERLSRNSEDIFDENPNKDVDDEVDTGNSEGEEKK